MSSKESLSRRELLTGGILPGGGPEFHVSSLVIHVRPENAGATTDTLCRMPGVEIHGQGAGKIIVTLETPTESDIVTRLNEISLLEGVLSAALVFHHYEPAADTASAQGEG